MIRDTSCVVVKVGVRVRFRQVVVRVTVSLQEMNLCRDPNSDIGKIVCVFYSSGQIGDH